MTSATSAAARLFARLHDDAAFLARLLAAGRSARRGLIEEAGLGGFDLHDVRAEVARILDTGVVPGALGQPGWTPSAGQTWADAPFAVKRARRSALVMGALASCGCAGEADAWAVSEVEANYLIVGAVKGGTTALNHFLSQHPDICTALPKETHFFSRNVFFETDPPSYEWFRFAFRHYRHESVVGEASPEYMYDLRAARRMKSYNPAMKLIFVLRHPAELTYSRYRMAVQRNQESRTFFEVLRLDAQADEGREGAYTAGGFYLEPIKNLLGLFPRGQMLFVRSEELRCRHRCTMEVVHRFLGVDAEPIPESGELLAGSGPPMAARERRLLVTMHEAEIGHLEDLLDWDLSAWRH